MSKLNLPKNWIVVNSSSCPDRVYYFNVKTKESTWTMPPSNDAKMASEQGPAKRPRRGAQSNDSEIPRPSTPEQDPAEKIAQRKKLVARRILPPTVIGSKNETPQMIALREKIAKKKEQTASKANKSVINNRPVRVPVSRITRKSESPKVTAKESPKKKEEKLTPQMQVLLEKMQQRNTKEKPISARERRATIAATSKKILDDSEEEVAVVSRSPRISCRRISELEIVGTPMNSKTKERSSAQNSVKSVSESDSCEEVSVSPLSSSKSPPSVSSRSSVGRKNLGQERMTKLRRSLKLERHKLSQLANARRSLPQTSTIGNDVPDAVLPDIYKNVSVRLVRLKDKIVRNDTSMRKKLIEKPADETTKTSTSTRSATTVDDLVRQSVQSCMYEEMDWEPMEDDKITDEVQAVRNQLCAATSGANKSNIPKNYLGQSLSSNQQEKKQLYIVVDTNVFLSNLPAIDVARETKFATYDHPIIVVPWTVIRELDYIKDNRDHTRSRALMHKARCAVNYLNKLFSAKQRVIGQKPEDVKKNKEKFAIDCPDDEILQTCLHIRDLKKAVVLLSYDKNLCNKAMIHDITTLGRTDPLEKVDFLKIADNANEIMQSFIRQEDDTCSARLPEPDVIEEVFEGTQTVIKDFLTDVVSKEMRVLFGEFWENYAIIRPPWTALSVLKCAIKHWIAATSESFSRRGEDVLKELLRTFSAFPSEGRKLKDVVHTIDRCRDLIQMASSEKHAQLMLQTLEKIDDLKEKISDYEIQQKANTVAEVIGVEDGPSEQELRAEKAFRFFEAAYAHSRDICGLAAEIVGMPFPIPYQRPTSVPPLDYIKQIQPEYAANVNKLLLILSAALEEAGNASTEHRTLLNLHQALVTFLPESLALQDDLSPLDVLCCIKHKLEMLKAGLRQLQELSTQYCRLASYRRT